LPLLERVRIEVYLPDPPQPEYENLLHSLANEFTYTFGGCSVVRGIEGNYLSNSGVRIPDRISVVYTDAPIAFSTEFAVVAAYSRKLKEAVVEALAEEAVMISVEQVYHSV
jgi:hypothetical protein